jgi:hypothetical protein
VAKTVADQFAETLAAGDVKRIYGIVGESLNRLTDSIRRQGKIEWIDRRHEEVAAFGAEAHLTGELVVCAGSWGPANLHPINRLFDCHRSRVPVLVIAAQVPSAEIGSGYFQETHPKALFQECSHYCELMSGANQMPRTLEVTIREAVGKRGVSMLYSPWRRSAFTSSSFCIWAADLITRSIFWPSPLEVLIVFSRHRRLHLDHRPPERQHDADVCAIVGDSYHEPTRQLFRRPTKGPFRHPTQAALVTSRNARGRPHSRPLRRNLPHDPPQHTARPTRGIAGLHRRRSVGLDNRRQGTTERIRPRSDVPVACFLGAAPSPTAAQ